ncbi:MAG TPA: HAMP domain-containing sensor histidine kinase [Polyangiales bacterium]
MSRRDWQRHHPSTRRRDLREAVHIAHWRRAHHARRWRRPLQRQLFFSFGLAIVAAMGVSAWVASALPDSLSGRPFGRGIAYLAAGMVVWALAGLWARRLVGPLREITRAASELGAGKLDSRARLPPYGARELLELGRSFNDMASRIEVHVKDKNELLHAVSHELRTPLARLRILLGILADSNTHPKLTDDLEREVLELDQLVGELLAGARIDAGALSPRELSVKDALDTCLTRSGSEQAELEIDAAAASVRADPTLLSRALMVLLDNAHKHGGGARRVRVSREGELVRVAVCDQGQGFDPADLARLFTPFARGRGALPDEQRGLGLGLYLVRRIAEAHGGAAFAQNGEGGGAEVGFTLRG